MQLSSIQPRIFRLNHVAIKEVKQSKSIKNTNDNFVITIDLQKPVRIITAVCCVLEAGLINGKKYEGI